MAVLVASNRDVGPGVALVVLTVVALVIVAVVVRWFWRWARS